MCNECFLDTIDNFKYQEQRKRQDEERRLLQWNSARSALTSTIDEAADLILPPELIDIVVQYCLIQRPSVHTQVPEGQPGGGVRYCIQCFEAKSIPPVLFTIEAPTEGELIDAAIDLFQTTREVLVDHSMKRLRQRQQNNWVIKFSFS